LLGSFLTNKILLLFKSLADGLNILIHLLPTIVRALWAWEDTNATTYLGVGAEGDANNGAGLSVISNGQRTVLTPTISELDLGIYTQSASIYTPYFFSCTGAASSATATITLSGYHSLLK